MIGRSYHGYRAVTKVRDGGMGSIFKAQGPDGRYVAVKVISEAGAADPAMRKAFRREAVILEHLQHKGIVRFIGYYEVEPLPYMLLEFIEGQNLKYTLWHLPEVIEGRRASFLYQAALALQHCHQQGVIHRDVKPENLLASANGDLRLVDFSIALSKWDSYKPTAVKGKVEGTPLYMSPEQIRGESLDARADQYALGAVAYELYTKRPPFVGSSQTSILDKHLKEPPAPMRSLNQNVAPELDELVQKMLSKRREQRFDDLTTVMLALSKIAKREEDSRQTDEIRRRRMAARTAEKAGLPPPPGSGQVRPSPGPMPAVGAVMAPPPPRTSTRPTPGPLRAVGSLPSPASFVSARPTPAVLRAVSDPKLPPPPAAGATRPTPTGLRAVPGALPPPPVTDPTKTKTEILPAVPRPPDDEGEE